MMRVRIVEDHDEVLKIWRQARVKGSDLVHVDAHVDFGFYSAKPLDAVFNEAQSVEELKTGLERTLAYLDYEPDLSKQTTIGNYVYPAMKEGIVRDFTWVIPGRAAEFERSRKAATRILSQVLGGAVAVRREGVGRLACAFLGRTVRVCCLESLPVMKDSILLDIDADFLVIDSVRRASATDRIGKRRPWISPEALVGVLRRKVGDPFCVTVARSVNGGFTPMRYRHLAEEVAFLYAPDHFCDRRERSRRAAGYFERFVVKGRSEDYSRAAGLEPGYRAADNNFGPLYFSLRKFRRAKAEFGRILRADPKNAACWAGLGNIALERGAAKEARACFVKAVSRARGRVFCDAGRQSFLGWGLAEVRLGNDKKAKALLSSCERRAPLNPMVRYSLGLLHEREGAFDRAARFYRDAIRLGFGTIDPLMRLSKICNRCRCKGDIIEYIRIKCRFVRGGIGLSRRARRAVEAVERRISSYGR